MKNTALLIPLLLLVGCDDPTGGGKLAITKHENGRGEDVESVRKAAEQGDANAQTILGRMYKYGIRVLKDEKEAVKWFRKAAEQGYANAQIAIGSMYLLGDGVLKDDKEAVKWFRKAAEQGNAHAQATLGSMYRDGRGVLKDEKEAVKWCRKAAEQGELRAQYMLGAMYVSGEGVPEDSVMAYAWLNIASANGGRYGLRDLGWLARDEKSTLAKQMTKEQIAEAQKLSRKLYDEIEKRKSKGK